MPWNAYVGTLSDVIMAGSALYAAYNAKSWIMKDRYNDIKIFKESMIEVGKLIYIDIKKEYEQDSHGEMSNAFISQHFSVSNEKIELIALSLSDKNRKLLNENYQQFKEDYIEYYRYIRYNSQKSEFPESPLLKFLDYLKKL